MKIVFNGRVYDRVDQMPPEVRREYLQLVSTLGGDADGDGVPDAFQKPGSSNVIIQESIVFNGRRYESRDELPAEVRELLDRMPKSGPGQNETDFELRTTRVEPAHVSVSADWVSTDGRQSSSFRFNLSWFLVVVLLAVVGVLLFFWLSGIRPADLWRR